MKVVIVLLVIIAVIILFVLTNIRIVPQSKAFVIERLGAYYATWDTGLHVKIPFIDRIAKNVSLKEQVVDFKPQPVITKDNVTMQIDTVVFFQITDPKLYCYGVESPISAIENLSATTLRNIIGELELDSTLTSRDTINAKIRVILDEATDPWGIKVNRVELKNIIPPREIQDAMEKQMKAERERREAILRAEGEKKSTILVAEGHKESAILDASEYPLPGLPCNGNAGSKNNHRDYGPAGSSGSKDDVCKCRKALSFSDVSEFHNDNRVPPACPSRYEVSKSHASCSTP